MAEDLSTPVTVEELLPALIELASIQHDLFVTIDPPWSKTDTRFNLKSALYGKSAEINLQDVSKLRERTRVVLAWLLRRAKGEP
jgi:hypothetical protein